MAGKIGKIATLGVVLTLVTLLANAFISYTNIRQLADRDRWVEHTADVLTSIARMQASISDAIAAERAFLLTGRPSAVERYNDRRKAVTDLQSTLEKQTIDNSSQQERLEALNGLVTRLFAAQTPIIAARSANADAPNPSPAVDASIEAMDVIRAKLAEMRGEEQRLLAERKSASKVSYAKAMQTFGVATGIASLLVLLAYALIRRDEKLRTRASREHNRLANYNRLLVESTGEGIYGIDLDGKCTFLNAAGARILQADSKEVVGTLMHGVTHHTRADGTPYPASECPIYLTLKTGLGCRVDDEVFWRADRSSFPVEYSAYPIRNDGRMEGVVVAFADITLRKKIEDELTHARDEAEGAKADAEAANLAKSQFLANMSHELRTPLNAVIMYSELLQEEAVDRGVESFVPDLDKIRSGGRHLLALVNGVLDLSKIEAGKMDLYLETFTVPTMVQDVVTTVEPLVQKNSNKLEVDCPADLGAMYADVTKVRQILFNLLSNASKFTQNGIVTLKVSPSEREGNTLISFSVHDTGIGMTHEQLDKLFQPFMQADESTTRRFGGTGLGLAISRRFAQLMGGDIHAASEPGAGSTFTVTLPAKVVRTEVSADIGTKPATASPGAAAGTTVLVIDDDPAVRDLMSRTLSSEGVSAITAPDGEEGIHCARKLHPDLIFLDVMMPKMDGWAVLAALKADPRLANIPVVMLTIVGDRDMGYTLGASEYLTKPIDRATLSNLVAKYRPNDQRAGVLIVDDDAATRQVVSRTLTREGWRVLEAENGRVALTQIGEPLPTLILLDLSMPEMDGFEFLTKLRADPRYATIPVVVLTSMDLTVAQRARLAGRVEKILQKGTYSRETLLREVKQLVAMHAPQPAALPSVPATASDSNVVLSDQPSVSAS